MKTKLLITITFSLILSSFLFSSCETSEPDERNEAYQSGEILAKNIIKYYFIASEKIYFANNYQLELASILSENADDTVEHNVEPFVLVENVDMKINIFSEYISFLQELQKGNDFSKQNLEIKMYSLLNVLDSSNLTYADTIQQIKNYIGADKYNLDVAVSEISIIVYNIWQDDVNDWIVKLSKAYNNYSKMIDNIPTDVFDEDKLAKYVYEPYQGKETLIKIYKLNMKQDAYKQKTMFIEKTSTLMTIFLDLKGLYFNLSQNYIDPTTITWDNEHIENSLKTFENNSIQE